MTTLKVVVVDDNARWRELLTTLLNADGRFDVVGVAESGRGAIEATERLNPDVVLLDISMPGLDGVSAVPFLRELSPELVIVIITATGSARLEEALDTGVDAFWHKGDPSDDLLAQIGDAVAARGASG